MSVSLTAINNLTDLEVIAGTLIGESESLGVEGMAGTACTLLNRAKAPPKRFGGPTLRGVCLQPKQYDCWLPSKDLDRILQIANINPLYGPYVQAMQIAGDALNGRLVDTTNGAVSYFDPPANPYWAVGKHPCFIEGFRLYFDLKAMEK